MAFPTKRDLIFLCVVSEVASPPDVVHVKIRERSAALATPIRNLYLTGSDVALLGIMGALMGGVVTASCLLGWFGFFEV
ncbi:MAG: hypothetical protein WBQ04_10080, partial [Candidatus Acidiferrales bacterium]